MSQTATRRRLGLGIWALIVALVALVVLTFLPTPYVIERPGPVYDTLGTAENADEEEVPLIEISGAQTYDTSGSLNLTTVQVVGNRERTPSWFELALAWMDASRAVIPIDQVFPEGTTAEEREERNALLMVDSQHEATAAALGALGYDTGAAVEVVDVIEDGAAAGLLEPGDVVASVAGEPVVSGDQLRRAVQDAGAGPLELGVVRDGESRRIEVAPQRERTADGSEVWLIGITLTTRYDFPIDVRIQLDDVGGPSAGMMFALGIVDRLTPGELTGGEDVAGTGTITADGTVGPIGGIRQKLYGARDAGAEFFLAPEANCDEVVGHVPDGLRVFSTATLDESIGILDAISADEDLDELPNCAAS